MLLVDDDDDYSEALAETLESHSSPRFRVDHCQSVAEALEYLAGTVPDIILLDLNLADSQGLDTISAIRPAPRSIPIVALSSFMDDAIRLDAIRYGAAEALDKAGLSSGSLRGILVVSLEREKKRLIDQARVGIEQLDRSIHRLKSELGLTT